jgi:hypothetical protein
MTTQSPEVNLQAQEPPPNPEPTTQQPARKEPKAQFTIAQRKEAIAEVKEWGDGRRVAKKYGISPGLLCAWQKRYGNKTN